MNVNLIVQQAQKKNKKAFNQLYNIYKNIVYRSLYQKGISYQDCEDLAQDVWLKIASRISQLKEPGKFNFWLNTLITNIVIDYKRKKTRQREADCISLNQEGLGFGETDSELLPIIEDKISDEIDAKDVLQQLRKLKRHDSFIQAVFLYAQQNCEYIDLAKKLKVEVGTIKSRIARGKQKIIKLFPYATNKALS